MVSCWIFAETASLSTHTDIREVLAKTSKIEGFLELTETLKERMLPLATGNPIDYENLKKNDQGYYDLPIWACQPYVRPMNPELLDKSNDKAEADGEGQPKKKQKLKNQLLCKCGNVASAKCVSVSCKACCKGECEHHSLKATPTVKEPIKIVEIVGK